VRGGRVREAGEGSKADVLAVVETCNSPMIVDEFNLGEYKRQAEICWTVSDASEAASQRFLRKALAGPFYRIGQAERVIARLRSSGQLPATWVPSFATTGHPSSTLLSVAAAARVRPIDEISITAVWIQRRDTLGFRFRTRNTAFAVTCPLATFCSLPASMICQIRFKNRGRVHSTAVLEYQERVLRAAPILCFND
jgi:hypothetical protein